MSAAADDGIDESLADRDDPTVFIRSKAAKRKCIILGGTDRPEVTKPLDI
ncbi:hypothetical protein MXD81_34560 [Microbacteriaceae bacterium K1510]|nr:hypothetical protein [Microbacteriaceae bacterium K1510]